VSPGFHLLFREAGHRERRGGRQVRSRSEGDADEQVRQERHDRQAGDVQTGSGRGRI